MKNNTEGSTLTSILVPLGIALFFLAWGLSVFAVIGDRPPHEWYYGAVQEVPGKSPYSTQRAKLFPGSGPQPYVEQIRPQHVDGSVTRTKNPYKSDEE